jgi:hypothetical protein
VKEIPSEKLYVSREPARWWQLRARLSARLDACPLPDAQPGELHVHYAGARDQYGNARFVLYWHEPWASVTRKGVTSGTTACRFFCCDDRPLYPGWLARYDRVIGWPSGQDITEIIREPSQWL